MKTLNIDIRDAQLSDIDALIWVEKSAVQAFLSIPKLAWLAQTDTLPVEYHYQFIEHDYSAVAVDETKHVVGFMYAKQYENDLYILEFDVDVTKQKQGIGQQLIRYMMNKAKHDGFKRITLTTFNDVPWNLPFYEKLGFKIWHQPLPEYLKHKIQREIDFGLDSASRSVMYFTL